MQHTFSIKRFLTPGGNPFADALYDGPGFSFQARGIDISEFPAQIKIKSLSESDDGKKRICNAVFEHPESGLEFEIIYSYFTTTDVLEIEGSIFNRGKEIIKDVSDPF